MRIPKNDSGSTSLWMETKVESPGPLEQDISADVCIVGSGIAGLTTAYLLAKEGQSVVIVDKGPLISGQTARTTAHLSWVLDDRFSELEKLFGEDETLLAVQSHQAAIDEIEKIIKTEKIDCDFERLDGYLFGDPTILDDEFKTANKLGLPVSQIEQSPFPFNTGPCLQFPLQAQFHIIKYLSGLLKAIKAHQGKLFAYTRVDQIEEDTTCRVLTDKGFVITAQNVVVATDTPINDRFMMHSKQAPYRSYVIAASVPAGSLPHALAWDTEDPYHYIRRQKHASDPSKEWLIIGGEDHKTGQEKEPLARYEALEQWARQRFPMIESIDFRWSGQVLEPVDSLAFLGRNPHSKNVYIITGDSGHGMTHSTIGAMIIRDLIMNRENRWVKLYDPSRKTLKAIPEFIKENLNVANQYTEWVLPGQVDKVDQIPNESGAIIRKGGCKYAVYCDKQGDSHIYSAVCPHLGCIVEWNSAEKSWDCPCHGSRFDAYGHVLNGPAHEDLKPYPGTHL